MRPPHPLAATRLFKSGAVGGGPAHAVACRRQRRALGHARPRVAEILRGAGETFPRSVWGYSSLFERNLVLEARIAAFEKCSS